MKVILFLLIPVIVFCQSIDSVTQSTKNIENKWSFGVVYMPHFTGEYYHSIYDPFLGRRIIYFFGSFESVFESQFAYAVNPNLRIIFDIGYGSSYIKTRNESHYTYDDYGDEETSDIDIYVFNIGIKYYFSKILENKVSAYIQCGIGKQFAFVDYKYKNLYPDPYNQSYWTNNEEEYLEDLNSPFLLHLGFGTEYFFNKSLSLNANIRFIYTTFSAESKREYNYQSTYEFQRYKIENAEIIKRVGLGLNFYF